MCDRSKTESPYWAEPGVTLLITDARTNPASRTKLVELVYRPVFRRLDEWLRAAGLKRLNVDADEIFADLWLRDLQRGIENATFHDREHFLHFVLLRCRQAAKRSARHIRARRARQRNDPSVEAPAREHPTQLAEYAESVELVLERIQNLQPPKHEIVSLHFLEGLTIRQIASQLGLPRSTVHHELQQALHDIRKGLR